MKAKSPKKGKGKKNKNEEEDESKRIDRVPSKELLPNRLTIEIGFGLKRSYVV